MSQSSFLALSSKIVLLIAWANAVASAKPTGTVTVSGRVLDPQGKPVEGARLYSLRFPKAALKSEDEIEFFQRTKSDAEGRFRFELPRSDIHPEWPLPVLAAADGYGVNWGELAKDGSHADLTVRLVEDQAIEGRILSTEGKPLAGLRVRALTASKSSAPQLEDFLAAWKRNWQSAALTSQQPPAAMLLPLAEKCSQAVTDKDGRFRLQGIGGERLVVLRLRGPGIVPAVLFVVNRAGFDAAAVNKIARARAAAPERRLNPPLLLYGPTIQYKATPGRPIEGVLREIGSGKPLPGFRIQTSLSNGLSAVSDKAGHYKLEGIPKMKQYLIFASPPEKSVWLQTSALVDDSAGLQPLHVDFRVARGVAVSGRIIDRATGKGAPGFVRFAALPGNPFFDKRGHAAYRRERLGVRTDLEGNFRLVVFPGPGVLMAVSAVAEKVNGQELSPFKQAELDAKDRPRVKVATNKNGVRSFAGVGKTIEVLSMEHAAKLLELAPDAGAVKCNLFVDRGLTRILRIEDEGGQPLMGTTVAGVTAALDHALPVRDAVCTVYALDPKKPRHLLFLHVAPTWPDR